MTRDLDFENRTIVVTGGTRGIGLALTEQLVELGANLIIVGRDEIALKSVSDKHGSAVVGLCADLSDPVDVDRLIETVTTRHGAVSMLINNAASQTEMDIISGDPAVNRVDSRREIALNFSAAVELSIGLLPVIAKHQSGAIVNVTTGLAISPKQDAPVYCATKAALRSFSKSMRYQCQGSAPQVLISEAIMSLVDTQMTHGRGVGKISAKQAANEIVTGLSKGRAEIWIGKTKLLRLINRVSPALAAKILR